MSDEQIAESERSNVNGPNGSWCDYCTPRKLYHPTDHPLPASHECEYVLSRQAIHFARVHGWAYSTTADCYGHEPSENDVYNWCLFDPDEDDPPIMEGLDLESAQALYEILTWVARTHSDGDVSG